MIFYLFVIVCGLCVLEWFLNHRKRAKLFWQMPGPRGNIFLGNIPQIVGSNVQLFNNARSWANSNKDMYRLWIYPFGAINIYNPDDVELIISNRKFNEKSLAYDTLRPWLRDGLLLSGGAKWHLRRKILTPAFHFSILRHFTTVLEENSWKMVNNLDARSNDVVDVVPLMSDVALNSICETSMGTKLEEDGSNASRTYKEAIYEIGKLIVHRISHTWLVLDILFYLTATGKRHREVVQIIQNFPEKIIKERRKYIAEHGFKLPTDEDGDQVFAKRRMALLDLLLSAENENLITDEGIKEEVHTFMFEGHDTTSMGLSFAAMELANNKHIQDKVVEELRSVFGDSTRPATIGDLNQLKYLDNCIKETLRLYPPVPFISRNIDSGLTLSNGTVVPPGNNLCHIHIFDMHRRPDLFEDPLVFNPDRFTAENCDKRHPYAYIPFSGGPRNCIGQKFAMLEMKSVLAALLRRYELLPDTRRDELEFTADLVLRTSHPINVRLKNRI